MVDQDYMYVTGRYLNGDIFAPNTKNMKGGPLVTKDGRSRIEYWIRIAVLKTDPGMLKEYAKMQQIAALAFPGGESAWPDFSWKIQDGDNPKYAGREACAGCYLMKFSTGFDSFPIVSRLSGAADPVPIGEQDIKTGDYVQIAFTAQGNGDRTKPGLYVNLSLIELVGYGDKIVSGPSSGTILDGAGAAVLPAGASATPVATGPPITPETHTTIVPTVPAEAIPITGPVIPAAPPIAPVTPAPDFLTPPVMTAKAAGASYQQFIDQGWTKEQLVAQGYVTP